MMPDYESVAIADAVRDFAKRSLSSAARQFDVHPHPAFPGDLLVEVETMGLTTVTVPDEWGGGGNLCVAGVIVEELATTCPGFATIVAASLWSLAPLVLAPDRAKAKRLFSTLLSHSEGRKIAALVSPDSGRRPAVTAMPESGGYLLSGTAPFVLNAGIASLYVAFASSSEGVVCCAVPASSPGIRLSAPIQKLGLHITPCADLSFDTVRVDADCVIADPEESASLLASTDMQRHGLIGAVAVGCARAALREATDYSLARRQGGKLIAQHDSIATMLTDMRIGTETSRVFVQHSLSQPYNIRDAILARIHATEAACSATTCTVQVFGGYGYMKDLPVEKLMRDSQQLATIGGSNAWLRIYANHPS